MLLNNPGFGEELLQRLMNQASTTGVFERAGPDHSSR